MNCGCRDFGYGRLSAAAQGRSSTARGWGYADAMNGVPYGDVVTGIGVFIERLRIAVGAAMRRPPVESRTP